VFFALLFAVLVWGFTVFISAPNFGSRPELWLLATGTAFAILVCWIALVIVVRALLKQTQ
jgi:hypothetical protein